jgi:agmatine/peptidylarginine deiminase
MGPCELNHIENVKKPSRNAQQQKDTIDDQLCKQLSEKMVLDIATGLVNDTNARQYLNLTEITQPCIHTYTLYK